MTQLEIWAMLAQTALTYIFISVATGNNAKQTTLDQKQDLRTTKEDLLAELKDSRESLLRESEISTTAIIDILKAEIQKEIEAIKQQQKGNDD